MPTMLVRAWSDPKRILLGLNESVKRGRFVGLGPRQGKNGPAVSGSELLAKVQMLGQILPIYILLAGSY